MIQYTEIMIGKQTKGTHFNKLLTYLFNKEVATLIGGNMVGRNPQVLNAEFQFACRLNPKVKRPVYHVSLSLPHGECLDDGTWCAIAQDYLEGMGFNQNLYAVFRHSDRRHDHIHAVANRIRLDGSCVHDGWDYRKSESLIRKLEQIYNLTSVEPSWEQKSRSPTTGERRLLARTGAQSSRVKLQQIINAVTQDILTLPELLEHLQHDGITVRLETSNARERGGISYGLENVHFSGTQLGKAYSFPGLQKYKRVNYVPDRDNEQIRNLLVDQLNQEQSLPQKSSAILVIEVGKSTKEQDSLHKDQQPELEL
jgi:hypothetical protein